MYVPTLDSDSSKTKGDDHLLIPARNDLDKALVLAVVVVVVVRARMGEYRGEEERHGQGGEGSSFILVSVAATHSAH